MSGPSATIVVAVYRNRETLRELHRRLCEVLERERLPFELLFVNDACPGGSMGVLAELAAADPRVAVLSLARNVGQHRAVVAGLAHARGEWAVVMDADLQDPPEAIPRLLEAGRSGYGAVFAGRRGRYESAGRLATSRLFKWSLHALVGVPPDAGIFCALRRDVASRLCAIAGPRPFVVAMIGCAGTAMTSVPVERERRRAGESAYTAWARAKSGARGIGWALAWKARTRLGLRPAPPAPVEVAERVGGWLVSCR